MREKNKLLLRTRAVLRAALNYLTLMNPYIYIGLGGVYRQKVRQNLSFVQQQAEISDNLSIKINIDPSEIIKTVAFTLNIKEMDIYGKTRIQEVAYARHLSVHLIRQICPKVVLKKIGNLLNRDHSTVINSIKASESLFRFDEKYRKDYNKVLENL